MKKINWAVRFKNKSWLAAFIALIVTFAYQLLAMFEVTPVVAEDTVMQLASLILTILCGYGVIVDPTTKGAGDSKQALGYKEPKDDTTVVDNEEQGVG